MCVYIYWHLLLFKIAYNGLLFKFGKCWGALHRSGPLVLSSLIFPPLHVDALLSKHNTNACTKTHACVRAHTEGLCLIRGRWQTVEPRPWRAERSGSPAGTLTFTLKCFNRTKVDKGRQWRIRSYNGLATLQVYWTLAISNPTIPHQPQEASYK